MSVGFGALEILPLLPPSAQVSIAIALLGFLPKNPISLHHPLSAHDLFLALLPRTGAWPCPGVQWSWEGENGEKGEFLVLGGLVLCLDGFYF